MNTQTLFNYSIEPSSVFIASTNAFTLHIENPATAEPVVFEGGRKGDTIVFTFPVGSDPKDLVDELNFNIDSCTPAGFTFGLQSNTYVVKSSNNITLNPGDQIEINFSNVIINGVIGSAQILIEEYVGESDGNSTTLTVNKLAQELNIVPWLEPWTIGLGQESTLYWQSYGTTQVMVSGFVDGPQKFNVSGPPPNSGECQVYVLPNEAQRTYTVSVNASAITGDGVSDHVEKSVTLTQASPVITSFISDKSGTIGVFDKVNLSWSTIYSDSTAIKPPGTAINNPLSPLLVVPGQDLVKVYKGNYGQLPDTVNYTLTAFGYVKNAVEELTFSLSPVGLAFFKYMSRDGSGKLSGVNLATDPANWPAIEMQLGNNLNILTIYQPGGTRDLYYLGSDDTVHPQIQYFNAEKGTGGQYTFSWVTANLKSLVLNPGNYQIDPADIKQGSKVLSLVAAQYTLRGIGNNGENIISELAVPYTETADPNCIVTVTEGGPIPNYYVPSKTNIQDATDAIARLEFADIWRKPPFRIDQGTVRLDVQGVIPNDGRNWQVQINGVSGSSTISAITVQGNLATASTPDRQAYVQRMVRGALVASLNSKNMEDVNGPCK